jgi:hypothetical protein
MNKKEKDVFEKNVDCVSAVLKSNLSSANAQELARQMIRGAQGGSEFNEENFTTWLENRFRPQLVWLSSDDYARGITRALPQSLLFASSDFGSSKQRDLGQLWTDTARGLLGEIAVQRFFDEKLGIQIQQDVSINQSTEQYIATDIKYVKEPTTEYRPAKVNISIKTGKFNARWLDEYSSPKISQVDFFIFVRLGTPKEHFVAYLKNVSFLKTKLFPKAVELGELSEEESNDLWKKIPEFEPIPAYISGYLDRNKLTFPIHSVSAKRVGSENYRGKDTRKIYISEAVGTLTRDSLFDIPEILVLDPEKRLKLIIEGIEKEVDSKEHFYANTGALQFGTASWQNLRSKL